MPSTENDMIRSPRRASGKRVRKDFRLPTPLCKRLELQALVDGGDQTAIVCESLDASLVKVVRHR